MEYHLKRNEPSSHLLEEISMHFTKWKKEIWNDSIFRKFQPSDILEKANVWKQLDQWLSLIGERSMVGRKEARRNKNSTGEDI